MRDDKSVTFSGLPKADSVWLSVVALGLVLHAEPTPVKSTAPPGKGAHGPLVPHGMLRQSDRHSVVVERAPAVRITSEEQL